MKNQKETLKKLKIKKNDTFKRIKNRKLSGVL